MESIRRFISVVYRSYSYLSLAELKDKLKENITSIHIMIEFNERERTISTTYKVS